MIPESKTPKSKPLQFEFIFTDEYEPEKPETCTRYFFDLQPTEDQLKDLNNEDYLEDSGFYDLISDNEEKYGVHDVSFSPDKVFFGYVSYEVAEENHLICVQNIRNFFISKGISCSEISHEILNDEE